jgi:hypothetical protein
MSQQDYFYSSKNNLSFEMIKESQAFSPERFDILKDAPSFDHKAFCRVVPAVSMQWNCNDIRKLDQKDLKL